MTAIRLDARSRFGRTGVAVTPLALGTSGWGPPRSGESAAQRDARVDAVADRFFTGDIPVNLLDTSNMYGQSESEAIVGRALQRADGPAAGIVVQTKLDRDPRDDDFGAARMWRSLEESLERLGLASIPVLYLHDPEVIGFDAAMAPHGPVDALREMKEQGLAEAIGISGGPVVMLTSFVETGLFDALVTHNRYTLLDRSAGGLLDAATARGMGIANAAPYGGGVLTGDPRFRDSYGYRAIRPEVRESFERMSALCELHGVPIAAAALQFSLREPRIHTTVVGVNSAERLDRALRDATAQLPEELWAELDAALPPASAALDA